MKKDIHTGSSVPVCSCGLIHHEPKFPNPGIGEDISVGLNGGIQRDPQSNEDLSALRYVVLNA